MTKNLEQGIDDEIIKSLKVAKVFNISNLEIVSIDFSKDGS